MPYRYLAMKDYKSVKSEGIIAVIIWRDKVLLLKRRNIPFIFNPGIWSFVTGSKKRNEDYISAAYREIHEETGIKKNELKLLRKQANITLFDPKKRKKWSNCFLIFRSETGIVKINIENSGWRWAELDEIRKGKDYTNIFLNKSAAIKAISGCMHNAKRVKEV